MSSCITAMLIRGVAVAVAAGGCVGGGPGVTGHQPPQPSPRADPDACPTRRFVGIRAGSTCPPAAAGWSVGSPFTSAFHSGPLPAPLDSYCRYDWSGRGAPDVSGLPAERGRPADGWLAADCQVVAPLGSPFQTALAPSLDAAFTLQVDATTGLEVRAGQHERAALVSIIDSSAGQPGVGLAHGGRFEHGYVVGRVVRQLACEDHDDQLDDRGCMAYLDSPLALPRIDATQTDLVQGGYFGSQLDLAAAIFDAVARFDDQARLPVDRQILNLSVGWSPQWGGANPRDPATAAPIRAVYHALTYARCQGALIIAAAGNAEGGAAAEGLMFPAAWTDEPAVCDERSYKSLVVAVGGVDDADRPLANGRPAGHPRLVAPADHAVRKERPTASGGFTAGLSGTSVAAAVASGAAAVVWGYRPELSADEVVEVLYASGVDLAKPADVCGASACGVRRISVCRAIAAACAGATSGACPSTPPTCAPADLDDAPPKIFEGQSVIAAIAALVTTAHAFSGVDQGVVPGCGAHVFAKSVVPEKLCPLKTETTWVARPFVDPQPSNPVCPDCMGVLSESGLDLFVAVDDALEGIAQGVVLEVVIDGDPFLFELEPTSWSPGDLFKITEIPVPQGTVDKASLVYTIEGADGDAYVGVEPLLVYD